LPRLTPKPVERPNTGTGLIEKRRQIAGQIEHHQRVLNELIIDLDHLDHTIRLFDPDCDVTLAQPKQFPPRHGAFRGEMQRNRSPHVAGDRRWGGEGTRARPQPPARCEPHTKAGGACLFHLKAKGLARDVATTGTYKGWELAA